MKDVQKKKIASVRAFAFACVCVCFVLLDVACLWCGVRSNCVVFKECVVSRFRGANTKVRKCRTKKERSTLSVMRVKV